MTEDQVVVTTEETVTTELDTRVVVDSEDVDELARLMGEYYEALQANKLPSSIHDALLIEFHTFLLTNR